MRVRYGELTKDFLLILVATGMIAIAATSPYFLISLARYFLRKEKYKNKNYKGKDIILARSMAGLNKNKIIIIKEGKEKFVVKLTEKGRRVVREMGFEYMRIDKPETWDGKWRIVIFDIPENKRRRMRDAMRQKLQGLGFYQMQKSVWVFPYECEKEIQLLCEVFEVNPFVNIITSEKIYNDDALRKHFKL
ncbi:MAG: CRISPR-associated endonuclease Cas2 [Candidatus Staskawiczbacteria bacterium RIFOXYD2_FULL_37_9]|uniref:CRISPR-associated endonuclease Cas2 n=1 Tax=Candidatus Staskawiczbacteria bacterium RIFOXYB1_FULL_37_44 TaxID=1802223 RepID=A0A1G2IYN0_9BACT|nr:MAG: CRISPR-associated endonuclease Cas2 [Candidatus Staskawiczbacteria bacterium RIFOXYB1_FULL_37_44]OGZ84437.1 MAG: CRISPR-associated endonuclease Cas2 [Candidatus Staskawiczbacteria bacterium RIFOXYC1_FULL_37_52]OGZ88516.1 MAG: CRISPR-associated endonuclease Cas2 [Candidatus Staskawiczbacteria bacterium RIFOXYC2_FULL_37_19]OGZ89874.1 MAG: CRISPR-associated endonuclease Cas2 [Candidatus Staskawiczbacteria bacterium RIFOXYD1_FULL_37_110]OGZ94768.1 MAG: CRISPR-associated endonuclease Cas2 [C